MERITIDTPLSSLLPTKEAKAIEQSFGYVWVADLIKHYPRRYDSRGVLTPIHSLPVGEQITVIAEVVSVQERSMRSRSGSILEVMITDGTDRLKLTWFNQMWRQKELRPGLRGFFTGKVSEYQQQKQLTHPDYELFEEDEFEPGDTAEQKERAEAWSSELIPIYPASSKVKSWDLNKILVKLFEKLERFEDPIPSKIRVRAAEVFGDAPQNTQESPQSSIVPFDDAMRWMHHPSSEAEQKLAKQSLVFREAFELQLGLLDRKQFAKLEKAHSWPVRNDGYRAIFDAGLPFVLTDDQSMVGSVLEQELGTDVAMHRLLQGEVASGKTLVALRAMLQVADGGGQSALLAPTEVLASQHLRSITETLGHELTEALNPVLLTGQMPTADKRRALLDIASGNARIVVGTHALMSEKTTFQDLGFIVIDEQHRFGVEQRDALRRKGNRPPHLLVMTATPIPRTIALTAFGDLDISTIRQLPKGRPGIVTFVAPLDEHPSWEERMWDRAAEEIANGRQVYVVCPAISPLEQEEGSTLVSDSLATDTPKDDEEAEPKLSNVEETLLELESVPSLKHARIESLTGKMHAEDKDTIMRAFAAGSIDILVATTVIEVGVNVPNASTMIIRDAHRFGISQLHQLRGRVGRGSHAGLCILSTNVAKGTSARQRVEAVASTNDGFELAEHDLKIRREGDVVGEKQSGKSSSLKLLRVIQHAKIIDHARLLADELLEKDPGLTTVPSLAFQVRKGRGLEVDNLGKS